MMTKTSKAPVAQERKAMSRVLKYENRKIDAMLWDASTEALEAGAFLALFKILDEDWRVYENLKEEAEAPPSFPSGHPVGCFCTTCVQVQEALVRIPQEAAENAEERRLYDQARGGEADAARRLILSRSGANAEYEKVEFEFVRTAIGSYPPREWGISKPCGQAYVHSSGLIRWGNHGRYHFTLRADEKDAVKYLSSGFPFRYDLSTKDVVDVAELWDAVAGRIQRPEEKDIDYAQRVFNCEPELTKHAQALLKAGPFVPSKVLRFTKQICSACKRDMDRFTP